MEIHWLHKKNRKSLIFYCNGWGMDHRPFVPIGSVDHDVLICSDYSDLSILPDVYALAAEYAQLVLVAWSMGVAQAQIFFQKSHMLFHRKIAINGTLCPIHDRFGIPEAVFLATFKGLNEDTVLKFYRRMCRSPEVYACFLENKPARTVLSQKKELESLLQNNGCDDNGTSIYTDIIISEKDLIVPTEHQRRFWAQQNFRMISGYHFPFYRWRSWDDLIDNINSKY